PNMSPNGKATFRRFHFAHLHGFLPETLTLAAKLAGLEPDPRFPSDGTTIVFRKVGPRATDQPRPNPVLAAQVASMFPHSSIAKHLLGGVWLINAFRRAIKDLRDTAASADR